MTVGGRKSKAALLVCMGFIAFLLMAFVYVALEAEHDCTGEDCDVCEQIARLHALIHHTAFLWTIPAGIYICLFFATGRNSLWLCPGKKLSLVSLKVRMND